ncbi:bifunctional UDP-N-acetylmuramoyl-tripeptide:D-alanyl-D-alanine ligase/alanine racemase [Hymenobacter sp. UV11]|uniref:bifunctional UDP-N-acetylmuramoyl-tripeptide:D-alanyl-D-alanine ligase/alanine racemase n=1 Tax=Hymenobacter sp. UV11 TaxID=1849735 RepID=UPI00105E24A2|nr:bifunctional UDP-N-acetylmuramoyl-tripeptide:D-alanyl-D-alanine ligase/alanine racemase [Hymenobacter sp. UV11]TDN37382.1 bifunctional UDP-N-acetylmuramoyl-tripeptide:D-alanyl-D-alanine ligase/alanine racemase [Hymenobacter sp. UV11]TFZ68568.1 bifunctional UDP-N-acetylmuramoyl-tripeptide:D-alanyl-D-alanine ligase/alanine racemase [Hymenobacter sp. UV11]
MSILFSHLPALLSGTLLLAPATDAAVATLLLDSRRVGLTAGAVFFALRGPNHDGHQHLAALYARGVRLFVVAYPPASLEAFAGAGFVQVADTLVALQALAAQHRVTFGGPVWAITGSNGKTIVKEWLAQLLAPDEDICRSPKSYNSQVGVPLSVWELAPGRHTLGIFEAGISERGEMDKLADIIRPTHGIFTTLGTAHDAGFASEKEKLAEKLHLFERPGFELLVYCADQLLVHAAVQARGLPALAWTRHDAPGAALRFRLKATTAGTTTVRVRLGETAATAHFPAEHLAGRAASRFTLPFADEPSVENALHCLAVLLWRQLDPAKSLAPAEIQRRLLRLHPVAMRLEMKAGRHGCYLLDDTYNNDLAGLSLALDALSRQARPGGRTLILSDVLESGLSGAELYARVAALVQAHGVTRLIGVGEAISQHCHAELVEASRSYYPNDANEMLRQAQHDVQFSIQTYPSTEALLAELRPGDFQNETILIKGARRFGFERVVAALQQPQHGTVLEVNLDALTHNLQYYRQQLRPGTKLMVMVKAFAYGSGSYEVASLLEFQRADYLAVAYADEGQQLRDNGISLPIMVLNPGPDSFGQLRRYRLEPEIYSLERLHDYLQAAREATADGVGALPPLHLKLDTGMRRLGFSEEELPELLALLAAHRAALPVAGIMTHLAAADDPAHDDFTRQQLATFRRMAAAIEAVLGYPASKHVLNSAGIRRFPEAQLDMVRLGVGLYGVEAGAENAHNLLPVSTLKTTISQVKTLPPGTTVGYGRRGVATAHERRVATLAIGYADGYDRRFGSGGGVVLLHGRRAPVVGSVCMDMVMVDVTDVPEAQPGDVAIVFGDGLSTSELAQRIGTIPYELLTNVSERVKRVFVSE